MNEQMPFERVVAGWMADEAGGAPDEALERILSTTRRLRPQPRWWALVTESPMRMRTTRVAVGLPNRRLVLLAALLLLLIALVAVAVGSGLLLRNDQLAGGDWSGFRGNADHSGVGIQGPTGNPVLNWRFPATGAVLEVTGCSSPATTVASARSRATAESSSGRSRSRIRRSPGRTRQTDGSTSSTPPASCVHSPRPTALPCGPRRPRTTGRAV